MPTAPPKHRPPGHTERVANAEAERVRYNSAHVYNNDWRKSRNAWIKAHPLCVDCLALDGVPRLATLVDHIIPVCDDPSRVLDPTNYQSMCVGHHAIKSGRERRGRIKA